MLHHPNVVRFLGATSTKGGGGSHRPALLLELCDKALSDVLHHARTGRGGSALDWGRRLHLALDAARGMVYLHARVRQRQPRRGRWSKRQDSTRTSRKNDAATS